MNTLQLPILTYIPLHVLKTSIASLPWDKATADKKLQTKIPNRLMHSRFDITGFRQAWEISLYSSGEVSRWTNSGKKTAEILQSTLQIHGVDLNLFPQEFSELLCSRVKTSGNSWSPPLWWLAQQKAKDLTDQEYSLVLDSGIPFELELDNLFMNPEELTDEQITTLAGSGDNDIKWRTQNWLGTQLFLHGIPANVYQYFSLIIMHVDCPRSIQQWFEERNLPLTLRFSAKDRQRIYEKITG